MKARFRGLNLFYRAVTNKQGYSDGFHTEFETWLVLGGDSGFVQMLSRSKNLSAKLPVMGWGFCSRYPDGVD